MRPKAAENLNSPKRWMPAPHQLDLIRSRLVQRLEDGMSKRLQLVVAPTGAGKTVAVSHWLRQARHAHAWLSLDGRDNDPARFLEELIAVLQQLHPQAGQGVFEALQQAEKPSLESQLTRITETLGMIMYPAVLVLDNYENIRAEPVQNMVQYLLDHFPDQFKLVICSQVEPGFQLSELRSLGKLQETRAAELSFTMDEATALFREVFKLDLPVGEVTGILQRSNSRAVNVHYAGHCLAKHSNSSEFLTEFENSESQELTFLCEFLLHKLSTEAKEIVSLASLSGFCSREFLMRIEADPSAVQFDELVKSAAFLRPIDEGAKWAVIHPILKSTLETELSKVALGKLDRWHESLAHWHFEQAQPEEAFDHALFAANESLAAEIAAGYALNYIQQGRMVTVLRWLDKLPIAVVEQNAMLSLCKAWVCLLSNQVEEIESHLQLATQYAANTPDSDTILSHVNAIRSFLADRES